jgi:MFS family permease
MSTLQRALGQRSLEHYPANAARIWYLALAVIATIILYYESYVLPSVAPLVITTYHLTLQTYLYTLLVGNLLGTFSALFGSFSDRIGRGNLIVYGLLVTGIGTILLPLAGVLWAFLALVWLLGFIEGIILVATPALVRDFSPRLGRALAMGFWTVGPVGGSVLATTVASLTLPLYHTWQSQYVVAGIVGLAVFLLCFFALRELSPGLRDQIMTSLREKELIEARARNIDVEAALKHPWRQMLRTSVIVSSIGIGIFLLLYYAAVGLFPLYLSTIFKITLAQANGLVSVFWIVNVAGAILIGFISDRTLVRKPYMLAGSVATIIVTIFFISRIGQPANNGVMAIILALFGLTIGTTYVTWLAAFTETLEEINPALIATGLAINGFVIRWAVVISTFVFPFVVRDQSNGAAWAVWWWVCIAGMVLFIPTILLAVGRWSPARAKADIQARERAEGLTGAGVEPA